MTATSPGAMRGSPGRRGATDDMSEFQYYEFQAVDRPLTAQELAAVRRLSTRAEITPTRFQNHYEWGDFKGDPLELVKRYYDAFVYVANWGTHWCIFRLPRQLLDPERVADFLVDDGAIRVHSADQWTILEFASDDEANGDMEAVMDAETWMPSLIPIRAELARGDLRPLYLAWLAGVSNDLLLEDELEPPVPPGLRSLSVSQHVLAEFLRVDTDLLAAAAANSADEPASPPATELRKWVQSLSPDEKDALLARVAAGEHALVHSELLRRLHQSRVKESRATEKRRTVGELLAKAANHTAEREQREAERRAAVMERKAREQAVARSRYLDSLAGKEDQTWHTIERLADAKRAKEYDQAVQLMIDLGEVAVRESRDDLFVERVAAFRARFAKRPALLERLDHAGL